MRVSKSVVAVVFAALALVAGNVLVFALARTQDRSQSQIQENQKALAYICSTTTILADVVTQTRDQIDANFRNGTYAKLRATGVISEENIRQAHSTRRRYEQARVKLKNNGACDGVRPPGSG